MAVNSFIFQPQRAHSLRETLCSSSRTAHLVTFGQLGKSKHHHICLLSFILRHSLPSLFELYRHVLPPALSPAKDSYRFNDISTISFISSATSALGPNAGLTIYQDVDRSALVVPFSFQVIVPQIGVLLLDNLSALADLPLVGDVDETMVLVSVEPLSISMSNVRASRERNQAGFARLGANARDQGQERKSNEWNEICDIAYDTITCLLERPGPIPQNSWDQQVAVFDKVVIIAMLYYMGVYIWTLIGASKCAVPVPTSI